MPKNQTETSAEDQREMLIEWIPVDELHQDPNNARVHDERNLRTIAASLKRSGFQSPIVIDKDNIILKGNGTHQAAPMAGYSKVPCVRSDLEGASARLYAIADNRTAELAHWDEDVLVATHAAIKDDEDFDAEAFGFTDEEIERMTGSWKTDDDILKEDDYDPDEDETYSIKITGIKPSHREEVEQAVNEALEDCPGEYKANLL